MSSRIAAEIVLRGLGGVLVLAALTWWWQSPGLVGPTGLTPVQAQLVDIARVFPGNAAMEVRPTLAWFLDPATSTGILTALAVLAGLGLCVRKGFEAPLLIVGWAAWLSIANTGGIWLAFQWDNLLVESLLAAVPIARWGRGPLRDPPRWAWLPLWLLAARLMFFGGLAKLRSGDASWWDGTALDWHFWTQPLPNPVSPLVWSAPAWMDAAGVALTLVIELALPFAILLGWGGRLAAAAGFVVLMELLALTGNYGWFQLLAIVLSLGLVDDRAWQAVGARIPAAEAPHRRSHLAVLLVAPLVALAVAQGLQSTELAPEPVSQVLRRTDSFRSVNRYGLFATMTKERGEIALEVDDGTGWRDWPFTWKPGEVDRLPPQSAPYLPRLEWRLWFAALSDCSRNRWVMRLQHEVLDREPAVVALLGPDPFPGRPLRGVRTVIRDYRPLPPGSGAYWSRGDARPYCAAVERNPADQRR